ncbi:hypothetical protein [uncultured Victivallis sp.]|uniref:hypothetical protein n=1 Tax=uncultured Victivallis sp. TaxID=354118 RepID=UPI00259A23CC|nr:hypothetical protein [uncultured Victivallis sp.]
MESTLEVIVKLLAVIVPVCGGLLWIIKQNRRIEKSQAATLKKVNKIDKHKVSYKVCDQRRAECPYQIIQRRKRK